MTYKALTLERDGNIAIVTLNRPEAGNSFDMNMMVEIDDVFKRVAGDRDIRAVILTGAGKYFSTGIDLSMFATPERHRAEDGSSQDVFPTRMTRPTARGPRSRLSSE